MAPRECDFIESLWNGEHTFQLPITNWSKESLTLKKGTQVGELEEVSLICQENSVWDTLPYAAAVRMVNEDNAKEDKTDQKRKTFKGSWFLEMAVQRMRDRGS